MGDWGTGAVRLGGDGGGGVGVGEAAGEGEEGGWSTEKIQFPEYFDFWERKEDNGRLVRTNQIAP